MHQTTESKEERDRQAIGELQDACAAYMFDCAQCKLRGACDFVTGDSYDWVRSIYRVHYVKTWLELFRRMKETI